MRPARRLVALVGICTLSATAALPLPSLTGVTIGFFGIVMVLAAMDWIATRNHPAPEVERILPAHPVKDRPATIVYRLRRPDGVATTVDLLDELPADYLRRWVATCSFRACACEVGHWKFRARYCPIDGERLRWARSSSCLQAGWDSSAFVRGTLPAGRSRSFRPLRHRAARG